MSQIERALRELRQHIVFDREGELSTEEFDAMLERADVALGRKPAPDCGLCKDTGWRTRYWTGGCTSESCECGRRALSTALNPDYFSLALTRIRSAESAATVVPTTAPRIIGNALICSDGTAHQLRALEKLYLLCGIVSVDTLNDRYRQDKQ